METINEYKISYNEFRNEWCASHEICGPFYFDTKDEAVTFAKNDSDTLELQDIPDDELPGMWERADFM